MKEEGHYTIKRVSQLPKKGNHNMMYIIKGKPLDRVYVWGKKGGGYEEILLVSQTSNDTLDRILSNGNITDKDIILQKNGEQAIIMKTNGYVGIAKNGQFSFGRVVVGGINEPKLRIGFSDDEAYPDEVFPFEVEPSGTSGFIRQVVGSHIEGFMHLEEKPIFRVTSMDLGNGNRGSRFEFGSGGANETDSFIERLGPNQLAITLGGSIKVRFFSDSILRQPGVSDAFQETSGAVSAPTADVKKILNRPGIGMTEIGSDGKEKPLADDIYNTFAELPAATTIKVGKKAVVVNDSTSANNGVYMSVGANIGNNGTSWLKI